MKNSKKKIIRFIIIAIIAIIIYNLFLFLDTSEGRNGARTIFGFKSFIITSNSMQPYLSEDDVIIVKKTKNIKPGDVITFSMDNSDIPTTHRVEKINEEGKYVTKGDKNTEIDEKIVSNEDIIGKVVLIIPEVGNKLIILKNARFIFLGLIIILLWILFTGKADDKSKVRRMKKEVAKREYEEEKRNSDKENY